MVNGNAAACVMWLTSRTLLYWPEAGLYTPVNRTVELPCVLVAGFAQLMLLGFDACTRVNTCRVGLPFCGWPLNKSTQPLTVKRPFAVACATPDPTLAEPHAAMACFIVLPDS